MIDKLGHRNSKVINSLYGENIERQPPQDVAAEQAVLGGMLLSKDAIADVLERLRIIDFYRPAHQNVYDAILDLYSRGEPADAVTVAAELDRRGLLHRIGGAPYLHTLISTVPTAANAGYYAGIVAEKAILRRLVKAGTRVVQYGYAGIDGADVADVVDRAQTEIYGVTERCTTEDFTILEDLLQPTMDEIDAIASQGGIARGIPTGFTELDEVTNGLHPGQMIIIAARPGIGKALALDTPLPTPCGWTTIGKVSIGDTLIGPDGESTRVVATTDGMLERPCFEVEFSDGTVIVADAQHQWLTKAKNSCPSKDLYPADISGYIAKSTLSKIRPTIEISNSLLCETSEHGLNHSISNTLPIRGKEQNLIIPPYTLGVLLGLLIPKFSKIINASFECTCLINCVLHISNKLNCMSNISNRYISDKFYKAIRCNLNNGCYYNKPFNTHFRKIYECIHNNKLKRLAKNFFYLERIKNSQHLANIWLFDRVYFKNKKILYINSWTSILYTKYIPAEYLRAPEKQRRLLLAGLLDTAGTITNEGAVKFIATGWKFAKDFTELVVSLGYKCITYPKLDDNVSKSFLISFSIIFLAPDKVFSSFYKELVHKQKRRFINYSNSQSRFIVNISRVKSVPVRCIEVDNKSNMYLASYSMIPTHNSTLGLDFMRSCSIKNRMASVIFSLEMSKFEIVTRLLSAEAKIKLSDMRSGKMSDDDWAKLARRMSEISEAPLYIDDSPNLTMMEIRAKSRRLAQKANLKLLVVDYMQLMSSGKKYESRQQEVSDFSRSLKLMAKELEVPVVAISQLNRGPEQRADKRPQVSDLRESGSLEQDADIVLLLHRPDAINREDPRSGEADVILGKHRNGPTANIVLGHQLHFSRFINMSH